MTVAVLGLGSIGLRHARNLLALGESVIGFDPAPDAGEALAGIGGTAAMSRDTAIGSADAVVIASPNRFHLDDLSAAISSGRHVFIEKPLAHTVDGVAALLDSADAAGLVIFAGLNLRFHPAVVDARKRLQAGDVGEPRWARFLCASYLPDWRPKQDYRKNYTADPATGGVLFDVVHEFDLAHHLLGGGTVAAAVARSSGLLDIRSEDIADVILRHDSGLVSSLHIDYVTRPATRYAEIGGEGGAVRMDLAGRRLSIVADDGRSLTEQTYVTTFDDDYWDEMENFLAAVAGDEIPRCDGREALDVLRLVIDARRMAGRPKP